MQQPNKQYGLIKLSNSASSKPGTLAKKASIFDESDDDSSGSDTETYPQYQQSNLKKQVRANINKAIEQDASIFQYDEVYDEMKSAQTKPISTKVENKPRYINNLLKSAELRKKEQELRLERKIQKERENEGDEFKDKESFVTSAYREKLEEMKKAQSEVDRQENIDNILDVTKQNDLSGFYRSLYKNAMFNVEKNEDKLEQTDQNVRFNKSSNKTKTNLRERNINEEENDVEDDVTQVCIKKDQVPKVVSNEIDNKQLVNEKICTTKDSNDSIKEAANLDPPKVELKKEKSPDNKDTEICKEEIPKKPKIERSELIRRLFTKRTVGKTFEDARNRYLERKSLRVV